VVYVEYDEGPYGCKEILQRVIWCESLALVSSPLKMSNTDLLVEQLLAVTKSKGHSTEKLYLYDYTIALCTYCRNCKKEDYLCCIRDEMQQIYPLMEMAGVINFCTPAYWYGPSAKMKLLIDRLRQYVEGKRQKGKRIVDMTLLLRVLSPVIRCLKCSAGCHVSEDGSCMHHSC
jgi:hypothetical protein